MAYKSKLAAYFIDTLGAEHGNNNNFLKVACPFCGEHVNNSGWYAVRAARYFCWQPGCEFHKSNSLAKRSGWDIVRRLEKIEGSVKEWLDSNARGGFLMPARETVYKPKLDIKLPDCLESLWLSSGPIANKAKNYLADRGFDVEKVIEQFDPHICTDSSSEYFGYLTFPFQDCYGNLIYFQSRILPGFSGLRWLNPPSGMFNIGKKEILYNEIALYFYDVVYVHEGITDCLSTINAIGTLGLDLSDSVAQRIIKSPAQQIVVVYDGGAWRESVKNTEKLWEMSQNLGIPKVFRMLKLQDKDDPAELGREKLFDLTINNSVLVEGPSTFAKAYLAMSGSGSSTLTNIKPLF